MVRYVGHFIKVILIQIIICVTTIVIENSVSLGLLRAEVDLIIDKECIELYKNTSFEF